MNCFKKGSIDKEHVEKYYWTSEREPDFDWSQVVTEALTATSCCIEDLKGGKILPGLISVLFPITPCPHSCNSL